MAKAEATRRRFARLSFEDGEVVVTPKDRSIFLINAEKAMAACRDALRREEGIERFESEFLVPAHNWCASHARQVRACYIPVPGRHIQVFIVTTSFEFDLDLADELAKLELTLAQKGWRVGVLQLPRSDDRTLGTFFSSEGALEVYAQRGSAPKQSGK